MQAIFVQLSVRKRKKVHFHSRAFMFPTIYVNWFYKLKWNKIWKGSRHQTLEVISLTMKSIDLLSKYLRFFGFLPSLGRWNLSIVSICLYYGISLVALISTMWFFSFTAHTFGEYVNSFFFVLHGFLMISWYSVYFNQRRNYVSLVTELNTTIGKCKVKPFEFIFAFELKCRSENNLFFEF